MQYTYSLIHQFRCGSQHGHRKSTAQECIFHRQSTGNDLLDSWQLLQQTHGNTCQVQQKTHQPYVISD